MMKKSYLSLSKYILFLGIIGIFLQPVSGLTPAADLTGKWNGAFQIDVDDGSDKICSFSGTLKMSLQQNNNSLSGSYSYSLSNVKNYHPEWGIECSLDFSGNVKGTIDGSRITLSFDSWQLNGQFTSNLINVSMSESGIKASVNLTSDLKDSDTTTESDATKTKEDYLEEYKEKSIQNLQKGDFKGALTYFNKVIGLDPEDYFGWYGKGISYLGLKQYSQAITNLNKALEINPTKYDIWKGGGDAYYKMNDCNKAYEYYTKASSIRPNDSSLKTYQSLAQKCAKQQTSEFTEISQCLELLSTKDYKKSITCFEEFLDTDSNKPELIFGLGSALYSEGRYEEAITWLTKLENIKGIQVSGLDEVLADSYFEVSKTKDFPESLKLLLIAEQLNSDDVEIELALLGIENNFESMCKSPPKNELLQPCRDLLYPIISDLMNKIQSSSDETDLLLLKHLFNFVPDKMYGADEWKFFEKMMNFGLERFPNDPDLLYKLYRAKMGLDNTQEAQTVLEKLNEVSPNQIQYLFLLYDLYKLNNNEEKATETIEKIRKIDPDFTTNYEKDKDASINEQDAEETPKKQVPLWVKNNAKWWAEGQVDDDTFTQGIGFLIKEKIIGIPELPEQASVAEENVPDWIKNNAKWWAEGMISEDDFIRGIKFLVEKGIIQVK